MKYINDPGEFTLNDGLKKAISRVFWGADETRPKEPSDEEIANRTLTVVLDFSGVTVEELVKQHTSNTTFYKKWYNNNNVRSWEADRIRQLKLNGGIIKVSVRELIDNTRSSAPTDPKAALAKTIEKLRKAGFSDEEIREALAEASV